MSEELDSNEVERIDIGFNEIELMLLNEYDRVKGYIGEEL